MRYFYSPKNIFSTYILNKYSYLFNCYKVHFISRENSRHFISRATAGSDIKDLLAVEYVVLFYEAGCIDEVEHEFDMNPTKKIAVG